MPSLSRDAPSSGPRLEAFSGTGFRVDGVVYATGLKLTPSAAKAWDAPAIDKLSEWDVADLITLDPSPEFLLLGTGASLQRPPPAFVSVCEDKGIGIEVMDSRAAARAWGVLRGEDRQIVAALLPWAPTK
jgi:uncharacterized protein